jgi:hypothetical protein
MNKRLDEIAHDVLKETTLKISRHIEIRLEYNKRCGQALDLLLPMQWIMQRRFC